MYKLLIVDDERYIVESLVELFSSLSDIDLDILSAYYGDEALEILKSQKIDLVFLDIKMPGISGIEVAKEINYNWPGCRIIFLTGYSSFDYLYEIKKMKNTSFLLKTEDNDTIIDSLRHAVAEIETDQKYQLLDTQARQNQLLLDHLSHVDILHHFLRGKTPIDMHDVIKNTENFKFNTAESLYLLYAKVQWATTLDDFSNLQHRLAILTAHFCHCLNDKFRVSLADTAADTIMVFLQPENTISPYAPILHPVYIRECLDDCITSLPSSLHCHLLIVMQEKEITWNQIEKTFDAYHLFYTQLLLPTFPQFDRIVLYREEMLKNFSSSQIQPGHNIQGCISALSAAIQARSHTETEQALDQLAQSLLAFSSMHHLSAIHIYHKISNLYIDYITQYHLTEKMALHIGLYKLYNLSQFQTWNEVIDYYRELSDVLLTIISDEENGSQERTISEIKKYIKSNLGRSLSLDEIANHVNYNSTYISRLFRQLTGENISRYIVEQKIEKAKEYLSETNESIQTISEKLGFETSQYFSNVFKKRTGISPREYRNLSLYH